MNAITSIAIQTCHRQMGYLGYQNLRQLLKIADGIDVKRPIPGKIYGDYMKRRQQRKPSYKPISQPSKYLDFLHWDFGGSYPTTQRGNQFYS